MRSSAPTSRRMLKTKRREADPWSEPLPLGRRRRLHTRPLRSLHVGTQFRESGFPPCVGDMVGVELFYDPTCEDPVGRVVDDLLQGNYVCATTCLIQVGSVWGGGGGGGVPALPPRTSTLPQPGGGGGGGGGPPAGGWGRGSPGIGDILELFVFYWTLQHFYLVVFYFMIVFTLHQFCYTHVGFAAIYNECAP